MSEVGAVSDETWQEITVLLALSPWLAFVVAVVWCWVLGLRDDARASSAAEPREGPRSDARIERRASTNT
jgi:hypothetical protein